MSLPILAGLATLAIVLGLALALSDLRSRRRRAAVPGPPRPPVPPRPDDWHLTFGDLMAEMKAGRRASVGQPELTWATEYERSLIPEGTRFPALGDVYEAIADRRVEFMTHWAMPYTGGGEGTLFAGERIGVHSAPGEERPLGAYALPLDYEALEARMVPAGERSSPKYGGFSLWLSTVELARDFRLVGTGWKPPLVSAGRRRRR